MMLSYSVIIPTCNRPDMLDRALRSVSAQTVPAAEIIIVEDGPDLLSEAQFAQVGPKVILIKNRQSLGAAMARNIGLDLASGAYVAFLDDDDEWLPWKMETQLNWLEANENRLAMFCSYLEKRGAHEAERRPDERKASRYLYYENLYGSFSSLVFRRDHRTQDLRIDGQLQSCQDWDFNVKLARLGELGIERSVCMRFYSHEQPRITKNVERRIQGLSRFADLHAEHLPEGARHWLRARLQLLHAIQARRFTEKLKHIWSAISWSATTNYDSTLRVMHLGRMVLNAFCDFETTERIKAHVLARRSLLDLFRWRKQRST